MEYVIWSKIFCLRNKYDFLGAFIATRELSIAPITFRKVLHYCYFSLIYLNLAIVDWEITDLPLISLRDVPVAPSPIVEMKYICTGQTKVNIHTPSSTRGETIPCVLLLNQIPGLFISLFHCDLIVCFGRLVPSCFESFCASVSWSRVRITCGGNLCIRLSFLQFAAHYRGFCTN